MDNSTLLYSVSRHTRRVWRSLLIAGLLCVALTGFSARVSQAQVATSGAPIDVEPDVCEPNDSFVAPCALQTEIDHPDLNFVDGTPDVYSLLLKGGRVYTITASSTNGVDLAIRVFQAGKPETPMAENDDHGPGSAAASAQVEASADGWYLVEVINRTPGTMRGKTYTLSARSNPVPQASATTETAGDILENNYDPFHAARVAWGVPYDLSLVCPDPRPDACFAGDHDMLLVPVKQGVPLIALTYDLGPGADTVLTLYKPDPAQTQNDAGEFSGWRAVTSNDDIAPGRTLRSQVLLTPTWTGDALLVVAESERRNPPNIPTALGPSGRYRLMVGSPALDALQAVLAEQSDLAPPAAAQVTSAAVGQQTARPVEAAAMPAAQPTPTSGPTRVDAPAPGSANDDAEDIIKEACTTGIATVERDASEFYAAANPASGRRLLTTYPKGTVVTLLGWCYIGWVKVQPEGSVTPGWMFAPDLILTEAIGPADADDTSSAAQSASETSRSESPAARSVATQPGPVRVVQLPALPAPAPKMVQRQTLQITVRVVDRDQHGVPGVKVVLVNAFGQALIDALTPADGQISFTPDLAPGSAVRVQLPAVGISVAVDPSAPLVTITLPQGER